MIPLYTQEEFDKAKSRILLSVQCENCSKTFRAQKKEINKAINNHPSVKIKFCSRKCHYETKKVKNKFNCKECNKFITKTNAQVRKNKTRNYFCNQSCAGKYNNAHRKYGIRRSKLETWLESKLLEKYSDLEIHFNRKDAINSELDIYIPKLKLAFELNGIFHFEPIFSKEKLRQIQNNDERKFQACIEKEISLCIIDVSQQKRFTEKSSQKYLGIIRALISQSLVEKCAANTTCR